MSLFRAVSLSTSLSMAALALAQGAAAQGPAPRKSAALSAAASPTRFTIRVENISKGEVLVLSTGATAPFVAAPTLWATHTGSANPIFSRSKPEPKNGLERLAETGNPESLIKNLPAVSGVKAVGADAHPIGAASNGPLAPGQAYEFEITAEPGQALSVAWMFGQSNDLFYSNSRPIALFDAGGNPAGGDLTAQVSLWDAGTEVNEEPGLGLNQGPRQKTEDAGTPEHGAIAEVRDQWSYPRVGDVLRFTVTPNGPAVSAM